MKAWIENELIFVGSDDVAPSSAIDVPDGITQAMKAVVSSVSYWIGTLKDSGGNGILQTYDKTILMRLE